ncbi:peptidase inhibitor family I36 protein [Rhodococcus erythropolis]
MKFLMGVVAGLLVLGVVNAPTSSAASWNCTTGYSCYYDDTDGVNRFWVAPSCGWFDLGKMSPPLNDRMSSLYNRGNGAINLYNWTGSSWSHMMTVPVGYKVNLHNSFNNVVDAVSIAC